MRSRAMGPPRRTDQASRAETVVLPASDPELSSA